MELKFQGLRSEYRADVSWCLMGGSRQRGLAMNTSVTSLGPGVTESAMNTSSYTSLGPGVSESAMNASSLGPGVITNISESNESSSGAHQSNVNTTLLLTHYVTLLSSALG